MSVYPQIMTSQEQKLADDFMRTQITKLAAETARIIDNAKTNAEISKLHAETTKLGNGNRWYVAIVASGATLAIAAIVKLFL